jgi:poly(3-hydroxybutyrate) depolymerase
VRLPGGGLFIYRPPPTPGAPVLVHFHGNAEQAADSESLADLHGIGLAVVEYPGYGLLAHEGSPSEASISTSRPARSRT